MGIRTSFGTMVALGKKLPSGYRELAHHNQGTGEFLYE